MADSRDPYEKLAEAIVVNAVKDYRKAMRKLKRKKNNRAALAEIEELERFFRSGWFSELTDLNPEYLIERLRKEWD